MKTDKTNEAPTEAVAEKTTTEKPYSVSSTRPGLSGNRRFTAPSLPRLSNLRIPEWHPSDFVRTLIIAALVALLAGFFGGVYAAHSSSGGIFQGSLSDQKKIVSSESQLIGKIAKSVGPSVVSVNVTGTSATQTSLFGISQPQQTASAGTGIIISSSGIILTNRHVVPIGTDKVSVTLSDGTELKNIQVLGRTNASDSLDVAFLKITDTQGKKLTPAVIGDSSKVEVGDTVVAIGNALGQFQNTITSGIISGYGRSVQASDASGSSSSENLDDLFQTDAAINEGNSGGPLVNLNGQVIGLNTALAGNAQNIGFSIPMNDMTGLIKQVMQTGKLERPYLGVRYVLLTDDYAYQYNLSVKRGAYIAPADSTSSGPAVVPDSPADKARLKEKDIITKIDNVAIDETHSLTSLLGQHQPGDTVTLTIVRDGKTQTIDVTLGTAPVS